MLELLADPQAWISLAVLTLMEVVLGIDNVVFITILTARLPAARRLPARRAGLAVALVSRLILLSGIAWVVRLTEPLFHLFRDFSGKDLILLGGGLFLLYKATREIYENVEYPGAEHGHGGGAGAPSVAAVLFQVFLLDVVFSLDSVITAVGMARELPVMVAAMLASVAVMATFAGPVGDFVQRHPSVRVLALAFLVLIGAMLMMEGTGQHVSKGYIYVAMAFSMLIELLNLRMRHRRASLRRPAGGGAEAR